MATVTTKVTFKTGGNEAATKSITIDNSVDSDTAVTSLKAAIDAVSDYEPEAIKYVVTTEVTDE